jgi:hypothetical protein
MSFVFVYSQYFYSSIVVDLVSREDDVSNADDDNRKMPAVETSPKRKQSVPKPAAQVYSPGQDLNACVVNKFVHTLDEGSPASQQAAVDALEDISSNTGNISKTIIESKVNQGATSIGMLQEVTSRVIKARKLLPINRA